MEMNEQTNVPTLRFPGFEEEWKLESFGNIFSFISTNSLSRDYLNLKEGSVKNIHYGDIHTKFSALLNINKEDLPYINSDVDLSKISPQNYCLIGDLIIADASEDYKDIGKATEIIELNDENVLAGLHTLLARPIAGSIASGFSAYTMQSTSVRKQIMVIAQGTKVLGLSSKQLSKITFPTPTLPEQQKIASFLSKVDEKLTQLKKKKELLEQYKKGMMQKIFSQEIRFKIENEAGELVEAPDWEEKKLGEVAFVQGGFAFKSESFNQGITKVLRIGDIVQRIKIKPFSGILSSEIPDSKFIVRKNDFLIALSGATFGKIGKIVDDGECYINQRVATFRTDQCLEYLYQALQTKKFKDYIVSIPSASAQPNISNKDISEYFIDIPSLPEQTKIANFLSSIDQKIAHTQTQIEKAEQWKKGLLQQLFV
jgi:type I restriction enzyme S subunit